MEIDRATIKRQSYQGAVLFILLVSILIWCCAKGDNNPQLNNGFALLKGSVKDEAGHPYPNTLIRLVNDTKILEATTDAQGNFKLDTKVTGLFEGNIIPPLTTEITSDYPIMIDLKAGQEVTANFTIRPQPRTADLVFGEADIFGEIRDRAGNVPTEASEALYARNVFDPPFGKLTAITKPGGDPVTLAEWQAAKGTVKVNCNGVSAKIDLKLQGMIPQGTYTLWLNFLTKKKQAGQSINFGSDVINILPLGSGSANVIEAGADGTFQKTLSHSSCILTDAPGLVLVIIYHINGNTYGAAHIPDEEEVSHLLIYFQ